MNEVQKLQLASPELIEANLQSFRILGQAIASARRIWPDSGSRLGTYDVAAEGLDWLMSADGYAFMDRIQMGPIIPKVLQKIEYKKLVKEIEHAAKQSERGRQFLDSEKWYRVIELERQADIYFKASSAITA